MLEENIKTPYFLIHKEKIDELLNDIKNALKNYWNKSIIGYSFKTNNLPWIIEYMKEKGLYAEVVSSDEFNLAIELGYSYNQIIFNGPVKGEKEFKEALKKGSVVNIDSKRELRWLSEVEDIKARIGLRVNFDLEGFCPGETQCGLEDGRFGFSYEKGELLEALIELKNKGIKLEGLHLHCSSKTRSKNIYEAIAKIAVKIVGEYNLELSYLDIGGGFFGGVPTKPTFDEYFFLINNTLKKDKRLDNIEMIIEPGMSVVGSTIDYITEVADVKETLNNRFVLLDGSRIHIDPLMKKKEYSYSIDYLTGKEANDNDISKEQILSGFTCMENDRFFCIKNEKNLKERDRVIFQKVGAYTMGLSPLFIQFFPDVYLKNGTEIKLVRKKWNEKDFIKG